MFKLRRLAGFFLLAVAFAFGATGAASAQEAQARFAFVIGNDGYDGAPLPTAANDAALVADALKNAAFEVTGVRNLDQDTFRASYREFLAKVAAAGPAAVSVVYISGYGLQADGENYLVPPGAAVVRDSDLALNAVRLSDILRPLAGMPGRGRAVLLDLAYAGPFAKESQLPPGLAIVEPDTGMIVAYNAAPGAWAQPGQPPYGPWAQALSEMLREAGISLDEALTRARTRTAELTRSAQVPWTAGKIEPPVVLLERKPDAPPPAVTERQLEEQRARPIAEMGADQAYGAALDRDTIRGYEDFLAAYPDSPYAKNVRGILAARREALTWKRTLAINTSNAYWSYLQRYPKGPHRGEARRRLARLSAPAEPPPSFEAVAYDVPPPPPAEIDYFDTPTPTFYDPGVPPPPPSVFVAAPPSWWRPPPPPPMPDDSDFFLPSPEPVVDMPTWAFAPAYVDPPPPPVLVPGVLRNPYVAIPAAVAAGIVAGKLINRVGRPGGVGPGQRPGSAGVGPGAGPGGKPGGVAGVGPGGGKPFIMPPTTSPPRPVNFGNAGQGGRPAGVGGLPANQNNLIGQPAQPNVGPRPVGPGGQPVGGQPGQQAHPGPAGGQLPNVGPRPVGPGGQPVVGQPGQQAHPGPAGGQLPNVGPRPVGPGGQPVGGQPGQQAHPGPAGGQLPNVGPHPVGPGGQPVGGQPGQQAHPGPAGGQLPNVGPRPVGPVGQPGQQAHPGPVGQPPNVGGRPGQLNVVPHGPQGGAAQAPNAAQNAAQAAQQQRALQQQQQQQRLMQQQQQRALQMQQQQQQRQLQMQQQQQRQQQLQAQQRQQQMQAQQRQQQLMQQQRAQAQQRQQQLQAQQRQQQMQAQQRQQQMQAQQRQQQMMQQQRQQQIMQQQRQQQILQQQRQQQMIMQQRQQQQRSCPPGRRCF